MIIKKELIKREIAGDTILVPVGKTVYDSNGLFVLNELGAFIWEILPKMETEAEIWPMWPQARNARVRAQTEQGIDSPLESLEGARLCWISDFCCKHSVCVHLLQQPQELIQTL